MDSVLFVPVSPLSTTGSPLNCFRLSKYQTRAPIIRTFYSPSRCHIPQTQQLRLRSLDNVSLRMAHSPDTHHTSSEPTSLPFITIINCLHNSLRESTTSARHCLCYTVYTLVPLLLIGALPTLAEDAPDVDPAEVIQNTSGDSTLGRVLGIITLVLLIYASVGAIILTIDNFLIRRNNARETEWVKNRIKGLPYPKTFWSPEIDVEFPSRSGSSKTGLNREQRRIEKKIKEKEAKDKRKKEQRAEARKKKSNAETKDS